MPEWALYALASTVGYLAGSIPFGLVITKAAGLGDIRAIGSGNIGATNVLRTGRKDLALATFLLDSLKAGLAALAFTYIGGPDSGREAGFIAGASAFIGHCYPVWLNFKGGKGIATYAGLLVFVTPLKGLVIAAPIWLGLFALTRISSLAALVAAAAVPPGTYLMGERNPVTLAGLTLLSVLVFWTHRANIGRLLKGTEPRFGAPKAKPEE
ncbi:MAG: glycerol-3-phosphate 1-O-acyltransferase PlsY [Hyphomonas sp.]|uniref:glycerol-3-phosphate 1-O-acyltransferase PlsY n=1 Tax=Hyphomonas sp. TaxID=87 RepID=UPI0017BFB385|nr:glycerol-3-phosphate 1-O-acyltransferase PlsY [Hyphomonas sp.]MBU3920649.1 glycerol-3-phosphate 1-O-acyltransferase PlsY [Alphaproteobacteria bacterium]MBA3070028.1 glycerol-3-phosphate 1-O-acyltransferase PlsY [Hyphomonas sp.]MBU4060396.1 glycerol-3-phosphate 1-O-acyltransferase PlsY [Alphaproteobacteria bacterium]MBU4163064.1 glycerol-3-phosphate 1-O-acyltransferase PlsY [Alphaproteobacteria bacterium]MBU4569428.1 glycerol-3-phosphate 1-O-acyltransferase PlsY [Alphaproteobacteria bacteriu